MNAADADGVRIEICGAEIVDELRPLWLALKTHHACLLPSEGEPRSDDEGWAIRSGNYREWIKEDDAFFTIARLTATGAPVAYAFTTLLSAGPTWPTPARIGYVESLVVAPTTRGTGLGRRMLQAVWDQLQTVGATEIRLGVIAANAPARAFYEALGFEAFEVTMRVGERP
jgi:ribosomal protein S18 acetylase RimI-like enzyme